jgi:hypothetical protein
VPDEPGDPTMRFLEKELDRQAAEQIDFRRDIQTDVDAIRDKVEDVPALRREVEMLKETVRSNTQVMYVLVGLLISSGAITAFLKGVI